MQDLDLTAGVPADSIAEGKVVAGRVGDQDVLVVRAAGEFYAVRAQCTHYRGSLADGIVVGRTIRCPLHHACFDLATGDALCAPALDPLPCWRVERQDGRIVVGAPLPAPSPRTRTSLPSSVVILGGGAAGLAAADMLRREGYDGPVSTVSADSDPPIDRPNLSKDYLAGKAQDDWCCPATRLTSIGQVGRICDTGVGDRTTRDRLCKLGRRSVTTASKGGHCSCGRFSSSMRRVYRCRGRKARIPLKERGRRRELAEIRAEASAFISAHNLRHTDRRKLRVRFRASTSRTGMRSTILLDV
jgi:nitrite reductase/ring-hydroxylating ferredoxin subunit